MRKPSVALRKRRFGIAHRMLSEETAEPRSEFQTVYRQPVFRDEASAWRSATSSPAPITDQSK
jgi:hypothetical protein